MKYINLVLKVLGIIWYVLEILDFFMNYSQKDVQCLKLGGKNVSRLNLAGGCMSQQKKLQVLVCLSRQDWKNFGDLPVTFIIFNRVVILSC